MKNYFLIINPKAGDNRSRSMIAKLFRTLKEEGVSFGYVFTERPGHAAELASMAADENYDLVIAVGGDGTVKEVASGLVDRSVPMGVIPAGSGNGLARELKIPLGIKPALDTILNGKDKAVDLWNINGSYFLCTAGVGFDAAIARAMARSSRRGKWSYVWYSLREALFFKPIKIKLSAEGFSFDRKVFLATFANAGQFGNNAYISPDASVNDGLLDVVLIRPFPKICYPLIGLSLFTKSIHQFKFFQRIRAKSITIEEASSNLFHTDGESLTLDFPVTISCVNKPMQIRVP